MREADLPEARQDLARALGWSEIPPPIWEELVAFNRGDIEQGFGTQDWEDAASVARDIQASHRGQTGHKRPPGRPPTEERPTWQLKDEELERSWAFSEYVSRIANTDDNVRRFRNQYLDGGVIHPHRARALLSSPAAAIWPALEFHVSGFPVLDHAHRMIEKGRDDRGDYSLVDAFDTASGVSKSFKDRRPREAGAWSVSEQARDALSNSEDLREVKDWKLLSFPDEEDGIVRVCVKTASVLGDLRKRVHNLIQRYPWWESEAVWFILTGVTPWVAPVSWQGRGSGPTGRFERQFVTIKVEPWVSEETVRRTYREAQVRMLHGDNRPAKSKQLDLFRFVSTKTNPCTLYGKERAKVAKELVPKWDREHADDAYGGDTRRFWRDYDRAVRLIALPLEAAEQRERERKPRERLRKPR